MSGHVPVNTVAASRRQHTLPRVLTRALAWERCSGCAMSEYVHSTHDGSIQKAVRDNMRNNTLYGIPESLPAVEGSGGVSGGVRRHTGTAHTIRCEWVERARSCRR